MLNRAKDKDMSRSLKQLFDILENIFLVFRAPVSDEKPLSVYGKYEAGASRKLASLA